MPANPQEKLIRELSENTLGRRNVFEPEEYRKGKSALREPADVAWSCSDAVVLMYLKAGHKGWKRDAERNLRQAEGWLTEWRRGRPLQGGTLEGPLSVTYKPSQAVMVLSVSSDQALTKIVRHDDVAARLDIDACATVSQGFLQAVADECVGVADLAIMLREWPKAFSTTDIEFFHAYCLSSIARAAERAGWRPTGPPNEHLRHVASIIGNFRSVVVTRKPGTEDTTSAFEPNEFFSAFTLAEQWQLLYTFGHAVELVREGMPFMQLEAQIDTYRVVVQVAERASGWTGGVLGLMAPPDCDLILNYVLGLDMMQFAPSRTLSVRTPTIAWRVMRDLAGRRPEPAEP